MNIRDLEYLVALAEHRHFRHAADACYVSQPTLSGQIKKLEEELGVTLLERTSRKVLFTEMGLLLVEQAQKILLNVQLFKQMANQYGNQMSGPLHIGLIPTVAPYLLPYIMPTLHKRFPELEIYLYEEQTAQLVKMLEGGKLDCAILAKTRKTANFIELPLFNESMRLAVSDEHPFAEQLAIEFSDLKGKKLLMLEDGHCLREHAMDYCFHAGILEDSHFRATSLETLRSMIASKMGMTLLPELATPQMHSQNGVSYLYCNDPEPMRSMVLIYRPGSLLRSCYQQLATNIAELMSQILQQRRLSREVS